MESKICRYTILSFIRAYYITMNRKETVEHPLARVENICSEHRIQPSLVVYMPHNSPLGRMISFRSFSLEEMSPRLKSFWPGYMTIVEGK